MSEYLDFNRKKTGMTIAKAVMLFAFCILLLFITSICYGIFYAMNNNDEVRMIGIKYIILSMAVVYLMAALIGFRINKNEMPFDCKFSLKTLMAVIILAMVHFYLASIIRELLYRPDEMKIKQMSIMKNYFFILLFSTFTQFVFILPIVAHGLLRNYKLSKTLIIISFSSLFWVDPQAVVLQLFLSLFLVFVYHRTASFKLAIILYGVSSSLEFLGMYNPKIKDVFNNYLRYDIIKSDNIYFIGLGFSALTLIFITIYFYKLKPPVDWQRKAEYETLDFT